MPTPMEAFSSSAFTLSKTSFASFSGRGSPTGLKTSLARSTPLSVPSTTTKYRSDLTSSADASRVVMLCRLTRSSLRSSGTFDMNSFFTPMTTWAIAFPP